VSESADQLYYERCADCPGAAVPESAPVLGPFIGLVGSVLCGLAGALLLLAPFAFDFRQGAGTTPRSSVVDLATGGGVLLVGALTSALFGGALRRRLRVPEPVAAHGVEPEAAAGLTVLPEQQSQSAEASQPEPTPQPVAAAQAPLGDPGGALRDLLTPLVAALAADLRARENSVEPEGRQS